MVSWWEGWWNLLGGRAAPGAPVTAVSRRKDFLDVFAVGTRWSCLHLRLGTRPGLARVVAHRQRPLPSGSDDQRGGSEPGPPGHLCDRHRGACAQCGVGTGFTDGWHGWWHIRGGAARPGAPVTAVSRSANKLDIFAIGTNGGCYTAAWEPVFADGWHGWWRIGGATFPQGCVRRRGFSKCRSPGRVRYRHRREHHHGGLGARVLRWVARLVAHPRRCRPDRARRWAWCHEARTSSMCSQWERTTPSSRLPGSPRFADGWHGWWNLNGGKAAHGSLVTAVSRRPDFMDVFAIGLDGRAWSAAWSPGQPWLGWWPMGK